LDQSTQPNLDLLLQAIKKRREDREEAEHKWELLFSMFERPIVYDALGRDWEETLPDWIKEEVILERLIQVMKGEEGEATDAEVVAYLYTASLARPISTEMVNIYSHLVAKLMKARGRDTSGIDHPTLSPDEERELKDLRRGIWSSGMKHSEKKRRERHREEKRRSV
jgi:hypothetical protein